MSPTQADVLELVDASSMGLTARQIADLVGGDINCIWGKLCRLAARGKIVRRHALPSQRVLWAPVFKVRP